MKLFTPKRKLFASLLTGAFLLYASLAFGQTVITTGTTVQASSIPVGNTVTINASGTLNMDVAKTFASITTANAGYSYINGTGALTVTGAITIASGNTLNLNPSCTSGSLTTKWTSTATARIGGTGTLTTGIVTVESGTTITSSGWLDIANTVICPTITKAGGIGPHNVTYSGTVKVSGTISNIDNFRATNNLTSTIEYNGTGPQAIYPTTTGNFYCNLVVSATVPRVITFPSTGSVYIMGAFTPNAQMNSYVITGSTIDFNSNSPQTIPAFSYNNLAISGYRTRNTVTLESGTIYVAGNLIESASSSFSNGGHYAVTGNTVVLNGEGVNQTISGKPAFNNLTISSSGVKSFGSSADTLYGSFVQTAGTMDGGTSTMVFKGTGSIDGSVEKNFNNLTIQSPANVSIPATAGVVNINGNYSNAGTLSADAATMVNFKGGKAQTLAGTGTSTFGNFGVSNNSTVSAGAHNFKVNGSSFDVAAGSTFNGQTGTVTFAGNVSLGGAGTYNFNGVTITGSLSNTANNRDFSLTGNWTNNGSFATGSGVVMLNGTANQLIGGSAITTFGATGSGGLTVNKTTGGVTLNTGVVVDGVLTLTKGIVDGATSNKPVAISAAGSINGASAASFVSGKLLQTYNTTGLKTFPIGKAGVYAPVSVSYTSLDAPSTVSAEQLTTPFPVSVPNVNLFTDRYWALSQTGAAAFSYDLTLDGTGFAPSSTATPVIVKEDNGTVVLLPASQSANSYTATVNTSFSNFAIGTLCEPPTISTQPAAPDPVCGSSGIRTLSVQAAGRGNEVLSYQWQVDDGTGFADISNGGVYSHATEAALTITDPTLDMNGYAYRVIISVPCQASVTSDAVTLTVTLSPEASFTVQPGASICGGTEVTYTTQPQKANYVWTVPGVENTDYVITSGGVSATDPTVTVKWLTSGSKVVTVQYMDGLCVSTVASSTTQVTALPVVFDVTTTATAPYCSADGVEVRLSGSETGVSYQLIKDGAPVGGALSGTGSAMGFGSQTAPGVYTVEASWATAPACPVRMSGSVIVLETPTVTVVTGEASICSGTEAHIKGNVTSAAGSAWTLSLSGATPAAELNTPSGGNAPFDFTVSPVETTTYTLSYSGGNGCPAVVTGSPVQIAVLPALTPSVTLTQTEGTSTGCAGSAVTFTASASDVGGGTVVYDFKVDGVSVQSSAANTFTTTSLGAGVHSVTCDIAVSNATCLTANTASTASPVEVTVNVAASIDVQPTSVTTTYGKGAVSFSVTASGVPAPTYQWQLDNGTGFADLPGETGSVLQIDHPTVALDGYQYHVVITNSCASIVSDNVVLTVNKADALITITGYDVFYDGAIHSASGDVKGVGNEALSGLDLTGTAHTDAGDYTDPWTFTDATGNYNNASGSVNDKIRKVATTTTITIADAIYDGSAHGGTARVTGPVGLDQPLTITYTGIEGTVYGPIEVAPTNAGKYSADASFAGDNNYNGSSDTRTFALAKADATITVTPYSVTYDGNSHTATATATGVNAEDLSSLLDLSLTTHTNAGIYDADTWTFAGNENYNSAKGSVDNVIQKADALIVVTPYDVVYDLNSHTATATAVGVNNEDLVALLDLSGTTHTDAGVYNGDPWTFKGNTNYNSASGTVNDFIGKATPTVALTVNGPFTYNGGPQGALVATIRGAQDEDLGTVLYTGTKNNGTAYNSATPPTDAGDYNVLVSFTGNNNYFSASANADFTIQRATPTVNVTVGGPYTYNGSEQGVSSATVSGIAQADLGAATVVYKQSGTIVTPIDAGTYEVFASYGGSDNYNSASDNAQTLVIGKANAIITITPYAGVYDGAAHTASGTAAGVESTPADLSGLLSFATNYTGVPGGSTTWNFAGNANYNTASGNAAVTITAQTATPVAEAYYTGPTLYWTPGSTSKTATLTLVATIKNDPRYTGDISTARVSFFIDGVTVAGAQNLAVSLLNPNDLTTGMASATVPYNLGTTAAKALHISVQINGNYREDPDPAYQALVTLAVPTSGALVVGGSKMCNETSAGYLKGAPAPQTTAISFYVLYNKKMAVSQGGVEIYVRSFNKSNGGASNTLHTYKVKSASLSNFTVKGPKASFSGKATVTEIVNGKEQSVENNCPMQIDLYDADAPGANTGSFDQVCVTVSRNKGGIWFSNNWDGAKSVMADICGGNVSTTGTGSGVLAYSARPSVEVNAKEAVQADALNVTAYPNPAPLQFTVNLQSSNTRDAVSIIVYSLDGKMVEARQGLSAGQTILLGSLYRPGVYILEVIQGGWHRQLKLVKTSE